MPNLYGAVEISQFTLFKQTPCTKNIFLLAWETSARSDTILEVKNCPIIRNGYFLCLILGEIMGGEEEQILKVG